MVDRTFYAMYRRYGFGQTRSTRDKLLMERMHTCPGCLYHDHPKQRQVFDRYQKLEYRYGHPARTMYWRSHPKEHEQLMNAFSSRRFKL